VTNNGIEAQQVQQAVGGQQQHLVERGVARGLGLGDGHLRAQHDVAEQARGRDGVVAAGTQLVHGEAQHVGGAGLVHPLHVQLLHRCLVDEHDRELGVLVHVQLVERVADEALQGGLVDGDGGLVVDLDRHQRLQLRWGLRPWLWRSYSRTWFSASYFVYASTIWPTSV
jgi:hypothetical protein